MDIEQHRINKIAHVEKLNAGLPSLKYPGYIYVGVGEDDDSDINLRDIFQCPIYSERETGILTEFDVVGNRWMGTDDFRDYYIRVGDWQGFKDKYAEVKIDWKKVVIVADGLKVYDAIKWFVKNGPDLEGVHPCKLIFNNLYYVYLGVDAVVVEPKYNMATETRFIISVNELPDFKKLYKKWNDDNTINISFSIFNPVFGVSNVYHSSEFYYNNPNKPMANGL